MSNDMERLLPGFEKLKTLDIEPNDVKLTKYAIVCKSNDSLRFEYFTNDHNDGIRKINELKN